MRRWMISAVTVVALAALTGCQGAGQCCSTCTPGAMAKCSECGMGMKCCEMVAKCNACGKTALCGDMMVKCGECGKEMKCRDAAGGKCACGKALACPTSVKCVCGKGDMKCTCMCEKCAMKAA